ncbi:MAG: hypothetical protein J6T48_06380 [Bacteroidales bacterium]|nr:hypothetical protein [Bacteroidales bacterium]
MKKIITIIIPMFFAAVALVCSCEKPDVPAITELDKDHILTVADIYKIQADSGDYYQFKDDYMLFGTITMDDSHDNIYKEAYIQDSTGGINLYKLGKAGLVKVGDRIRLNLKGGQIVNYNGKMEITFADVEDVSLQVILQEPNVPLTPEEVTMAQVVENPTYYDCRLVKLNNVQFAASDTSLTYAVENGSTTQSRNMTSCDGNTLVARNSDYADFAGQPLPKGNGSVVGIMTRYIRTGNTGTTTTYQIIIRSTEEVSMDGDRCD